MKRKKEEKEVPNILITNLTPRMEETTKRQIHSLVTLMISIILITVSFSTAVTAKPTFYTVSKVALSINGEPVGNVTSTGDIITYQINVNNTEEIKLTNVTVTDLMLGGTLNVTDLDIGSNETLYGNYTVTQDDMNSNGNGTGFIINNVTVVCDQEENPNNATAIVPIEQNANCTVEKTVVDVVKNGPGGNVTAAGDVIIYDVNVTNNGNVDLYNVTVTDTLIEELLGPTSTLDDDNVLEVGESWTYTGIYIVTPEDIKYGGTFGDGYITNTASVVGNYTVDRGVYEETGPYNATATVPIIIPYSIFKAVIDPDTTRDCIVNEVGDKVPYAVIVKNEGYLNLTNVTVYDFMVGEILQPTGYYGDNDTVLNPGEAWEYNYTYRLTQDDLTLNGTFGDGNITNIAGVICDQYPAKYTGFVKTPIDQRKILQVYKSVTRIDEAGDHILNEAGDIINYQIAVKNVGNVPLTVNNSDVIDSKVNLKKSIGDETNTLDPGELWVYTGDYTVTENDIIKESISNTATVTYIGENGITNVSSTLDLPIVIAVPPITPTETNNESENIHVKPVASFSTSATSGYAPLSVQFTDTSTGKPTSWSWDFNSDGTEDSSAQSTAYTYSTPGTYVAKLKVSNAKGSDSTTATINVQQKTDSGSGGSSSGGHSGRGTGRAYVVSSSTNAPNVVQPLTTTSNIQQSTTSAKGEPTPVQTATSTPTQQSKKTPGFEVIFGVTALLGAVYMYRRK